MSALGQKQTFLMCRGKSALTSGRQNSMRVPPPCVPHFDSQLSNAARKCGDRRGDITLLISYPPNDAVPVAALFQQQVHVAPKGTA